MNSNELYDLAERLAALMRVAARQASSPHSLQPVQLEALRYLAGCNKFSDTPMAVTEYLGQTKGTVSQTLKALEAKGLLTKQQNPNDKRSAHLKITPQGRALIAESIPTPAFLAVSDAMNNAERDALGTQLHKLLSGLLQANRMRTFGLCSSCKHHRKTAAGYHCNLVNQPLAQSEVNLICREHEWPKNDQGKT